MSRPYGSLPDRHLREVEQRVAQQKALVHRMIVQGTPTQAAEDSARRVAADFVAHEQGASTRSRVRSPTRSAPSSISLNAPLRGTHKSHSHPVLAGAGSV
jgi:hypothetical protein